MRAGSWQFPGTTLIHLCPVWVQEGLCQICNLFIANYIFKAFAAVPSSGPQPLFLGYLGS